MSNIIIGLKSKNRAAKRSSQAVSNQDTYFNSKRKDYKASQWARDITNQLHEDGKNRKGRISGCVLNELEKKGCKITKTKPKAPEGFNAQTGGFTDGDI
jgi:hypothetical protein